MFKNRAFRWYALFCAICSLSFSAITAIAGDIQLALEEPTSGSTYSGVSNVRGWAVSSAGVSRVELFIDGAFVTQIPSGGYRPDVGRSYPNYPNSSQSGFSMALNYSELAAGAHGISVNVIDNQGSQKSAAASFNVARFNNPYIGNPATVSLNAATITDDNDKSIFIGNIQADGQLYNVRLEWRTAEQGFAITGISLVGGGNNSTRWSALNNVCCTTGSFTYQVTIDGVTRSSTVSSCSNPDPSFEGFVSTTAGTKNYSSRAFSSACGVNSQGGGTVTLASSTCYRITLNVQGQNLAESLGTVTCPSSANAETLREEPQATPMAIFPMQAVDPSASGQERWDFLKNIGQP